MLTMLLRTAILLQLMLWSGLANAQFSRDPSPEFKAWWKLLTEGGNLGPNTDGVALTFDVEHRIPVPSAEEVDSMRRMTEGNPDHPLREYLKQIDSVNANGHPVSTVTIWRIGSEWRHARNENRDQMAYVDSAWANGLAWRMSRHQLIVDKQSGVESSKYRIDATGTEVSTLISRSMSCMLSHTVGQGFKLLPNMVSEDKWSVHGEITPEEGLARTLKAHGTWNGLAGTVDRCEIVDRTADGSVSSSIIEATDWRPLPNSKLLIASTAVHRVEDNDGSFTMISTLRDATPFTREQFQQLVQVPSIDKEDPVRKVVSYVSVIDRRGAREELLTLQGNGAFDKISSQPMRSHSHSRLRTAGWLLLAAVALIFVWFKFRMK